MLARLIDMRGDERIQDGMFSYGSLEQRVPQDHPLRAVRKLTDTVLRTLSPEFDALYADSGRPSLSEGGVEQAWALRKWLKPVHFNYAFSSDLSRAKRTCRIIAGNRAKSIEVRGIYLTPEPPRCSVWGHGRGLSADVA